MSSSRQEEGGETREEMGPGGQRKGRRVRRDEQACAVCPI
jgi:hypothetical protein